MSRLREALDRHDYGVHSPAEIHQVIIPAARRFLALTETGPDYEAAAREAYNEGDPFDWWERLSDRGKEIRVDAMRPIVDAALADYLTEEGP